LDYIFRHSDRNYLIFFCHFKIISVYDHKKTEAKLFRALAAALQNLLILFFPHAIIQ